MKSTLLVAITCVIVLIPGCRLVPAKTNMTEILAVKIDSLIQTGNSIDVLGRVIAKKDCKFVPVKIWMNLDSVQNGNVTEQEPELYTLIGDQSFSKNEVNMEAADSYHFRVRVLRTNKMKSRDRVTNGAYIYTEPFGSGHPIAASYGSQFHVKLALGLFYAHDGAANVYANELLRIANDKDFFHADLIRKR